MRSEETVSSQTRRARALAALLALGSLAVSQPAMAAKTALPAFVADRPTELAAAAFLAMAVFHTFMVKRFNSLAHRFRPGSIGENLMHFLGEVEVVFGMWAGLLVLFIGARKGMPQAVAYLEHEVNYTEPLFVFVIMVMAATRPIIWLAERLIRLAARLLPIGPRAAFFVSALIVGPLLGSFITEPAAMTVTALILKNEFYDREPRMSQPFMYATLGLLFVNVSIGGTLTNFAAPPVLMVAGPWGWDIGLMMREFGWKAAIAVIVGTALTALVFRAELARAASPSASEDRASHASQPAAELPPPLLLVFIHVLFMAATVAWHSYTTFFLPLFLFFVGLTTVTAEYQDRLKVREALLVGFFLGGLVTLGSLQGWWLQQVIVSLQPLALFFGACGLTAFTDNAAITFLGTQVPDLTAQAKYMLVAGAVAGGGLTVIANAPNPAGFGILKSSFGVDGISPLLLLVGALPYTLLACLAYLLLPSL